MASYLASSGGIAVPAGATNIALPAPAGTATGDMLVAFLSIPGWFEDFAAPSGWIAEPAATYGSPKYAALRTYYRVATADEPADYTWSWSGLEWGSTPMPPVSGCIVAATGTSASTPDAFGSHVNAGTERAVSAPPVTTSSDGEVVFAAWAQLAQPGGSLDPSAGVTAVGRVDSSDGAVLLASLLVAYFVAASAGSTEAVQATSRFPAAGLCAATVAVA